MPAPRGNAKGYVRTEYEIQDYSVKDNDVLRVQLGKDLEGYVERGGLWLYVACIRLIFEIHWTGNVAGAGIAGGDMAQLLRRIQFVNAPGSVHDVDLTGEYLRLYPFLRYGRLFHRDPADIATGAGNGNVSTFVLDLPLMNEELENERELMDAVLAFVASGTTMELTFAPIDWFDTTCKVNLTTSKVTLALDVIKHDKQFGSPPVVWRKEDRTDSPYLLDVAQGVVHYLDIMGEPVKQTAGLPDLSALTRLKVEPKELSQDNAKITQYIRTWEATQKAIPAQDDVLAAELLDWQSGGAIRVIPVIGRTEPRRLSAAWQPVIDGQLKFTPDPKQPFGGAGIRSYVKYVQPSPPSHEAALATMFGAKPAGKANPGNAPQDSHVASTAQVRLAGRKGQARGANFSKPVT